MSATIFSERYVVDDARFRATWKEGVAIVALSFACNPFLWVWAGWMLGHP